MVPTVIGASSSLDAHLEALLQATRVPHTVANEEASVNVFIVAR